MIPAVAPEFMPAPGSQLAPALNLAHSLFKDAGVSSGRIVIVTDEIRDIAESQNIARQHRYAFPISVLGVGTAEGAPIPGTKLTRDGGYLKDATGTIIVPGVDFDALTDFANLAGGRFARMRLIDTDLDYLLAEAPLLDQQQFREMERDFDIWLEKDLGFCCCYCHSPHLVLDEAGCGRSCLSVVYRLIKPTLQSGTICGKPETSRQLKQ